MAKSKSSKAWLAEHVNDPYVKMANQKGYRSRAAFKLLEIQDKDRIIQPGMVVVDLGAAPGGWSQIASPLLHGRGTLIALDILPMKPLPGVLFIQGDFTEQHVLEELCTALNKAEIDLVLSDMAPNITGIECSDMARAMLLAELALEFATQQLKVGGHFLVKLFQGPGFDDFVKSCRQHFSKVVVRKPKASRPRSKEVYLLAKSLKRVES